MITDLKKTIASILSESTSTDSDSYLDDIDDDVDCNSDECYDDIEDLDEEIQYTEEMVNVMEQSRGDGSLRYIIEYDILAKLCNSADISIEEAFEKVCEHNNINPRNAYLLLEDSCSYNDSIEEAKAACKSSASKDVKTKAKKKVNAAKKQIKNLKGKVNLLKKKDKNEACKVK